MCGQAVMARSSAPLGSYPHNCSSGELGLPLIYFLASLTPLIESGQDICNNSKKVADAFLDLEIGNIRVIAI